MNLHHLQFTLNEFISVNTEITVTCSPLCEVLLASLWPPLGLCMSLLHLLIQHPILPSWKVCIFRPKFQSMSASNASDSRSTRKLRSRQVYRALNRYKSVLGYLLKRRNSTVCKPTHTIRSPASSCKLDSFLHYRKVSIAWRHPQSTGST